MDFDATLVGFIIFPVLALLANLVIIPLACRAAIRYGFVDAPDQPGGRKQHEAPVPPIGGIILFSIFGLFAALTESSFENEWAYYIALTLLLIVGLIDDHSGKNGGVPAKIKFAVHFLVAFIVVLAGDARIDTLGNLLGNGDINLGIMTVPFSVACVVYIINAINMMDGLDGLAAGKSFIIFGWFFVACLLSGWWEPATLLFILMACLLGFLFYNYRTRVRPRAIVFLGDAGSMALGLTIAWFSINLSQGPEPVLAPAAVAWIIALPIIDAFGLLVARLKEGKHPFFPDRRHFHHHFIDAGFTVKHAARSILGYSLLLGAIGFIATKLNVPEPVLGWGWIALWLGHAALVMYPNRFKAMLKNIYAQRSKPKSPA